MSLLLASGGWYKTPIMMRQYPRGSRFGRNTHHKDFRVKKLAKFQILTNRL